ncbi:chymotrypsin-1-like [Melitaea cinxia]|uniref:chymotrypsin-1-like n=1 Tax=Melitaea cinxia TaxID=113334 RepID=UPI001E27227D|nr:chymotrypsin-1-like [Melitaea cinxia]
MKTAVILLSLVVYASTATLPQISYDSSPYGYLTKYGIPEADRIREAEEKILSGSRITGGSPAALGQFKYQAGLLSEIIGIPSDRRGVCGASLISANRLVTAAHCWFDGRNQASRLTVVLGSNFLNFGGTRIQTSDVVVHPLWFPLLVRNDIALIRLANNVLFSDTIGPIALPTGALTSQTFEGEAGVASGFGITADGGGIANNQFLSYVSMNILSHAQCVQAFPLQASTATLCTQTTGGTSTCRGDSGGPLVVQRDNNPVLVGITSFGIAFGCTIGYPAAFVRVTSYVNFINENL